MTLIAKLAKLCVDNGLTASIKGLQVVVTVPERPAIKLYGQFLTDANFTFSIAKPGIPETLQGFNFSPGTMESRLIEVVQGIHTRLSC